MAWLSEEDPDTTDVRDPQRLEAIWAQEECMFLKQCLTSWVFRTRLSKHSRIPGRSHESSILLGPDSKWHAARRITWPARNNSSIMSYFNDNNRLSYLTELLTPENRWSVGCQNTWYQHLSINQGPEFTLDGSTPRWMVSSSQSYLFRFACFPNFSVTGPCRGREYPAWLCEVVILCTVRGACRVLARDDRMPTRGYYGKTMGETLHTRQLPTNRPSRQLVVPESVRRAHLCGWSTTKLD